MIRHALIAALMVGLATPAFAQGKAFADALVRMHAGVSRNAVEAAEKMPEAEFAFTPSKDVRTFGGFIGHIANSEFNYCARAKGEANPNKEDFEKFIKSHRSSRELMEGAVFEDYQGYAHLPYHTDTFFSTSRWGLTGEAGAFVDPFYSPGSDFIATANEFLTSLILTDLGDKPEELPERVELYNAFYKLKYESVIRLYAKLYPIFGSYEIYRIKYAAPGSNTGNRPRALRPRPTASRSRESESAPPGRRSRRTCPARQSCRVRRRSVPRPAPSPC